jgi:phage-related protein
MPDKPLIWLGSSRRDLPAFPAIARRLAGPGVREIRIHIGGAHRVFYLVTRADAIYVLHAFEKKTQRTSSHDLQIGRDRFRALGN